MNSLLESYANYQEEYDVPKHELETMICDLDELYRSFLLVREIETIEIYLESVRLGLLSGKDTTLRVQQVLSRIDIHPPDIPSQKRTLDVLSGFRGCFVIFLIDLILSVLYNVGNINGFLKVSMLMAVVRYCGTRDEGFGFSTSRFKLQHYGIERKVAELATDFENLNGIRVSKLTTRSRPHTSLQYYDQYATYEQTLCNGRITPLTHPPDASNFMADFTMTYRIPESFDHKIHVESWSGIDTGFCGELLVYHYLKWLYKDQPEMIVDWVNRLEETGLQYDIVIRNNITMEEEYIDVKPTTSHSPAFTLFRKV
ncbi:hypothetical protein HK098_006105 [Nowakowskiella sp. JEL0407]|nr:hypothetical protein HK098_006105 [Nowakowskiella sp. JEL0407]